ncbi:MAG TPA: T9SS type A sorting domain-containing protein, partial [Candidatus Saccharimonadales bacterium]
CSGASATLTASGGSTYSWSPATDLGATTGVTVTASPTVTTTYAVTGTNSGGCSATKTVTITVKPSPTITATPSPASYCAGGSSTLKASGGNAYTWSPATSLSTTTGSNVTANPIVTTTYTVTGTNAGGCSATKNVTVTVNPTPTITATPNPASYCSGGSAILSASGGNIYTWSPATDLSATTGSSVTANPAVTTTYTVTGTNSNNCVNTSTAIVTVIPVLGIPSTPSGATTLCQASSSTTYTTSAINATFYTWSISGAGASTISGTGATGTVAWDPTFSGTATITVKAGNPCGTSTAVSTGVTVNSTGTWLGALGTNWDLPGNWCGGLPTATTNVTIPGTSFVPNEPEVKYDGAPPAGPAYCHNLTINSGATVTVDGSGLLNIYGDVINNGTFNNTSAGGIAFRGNTLQTIPALTVNDCQVIDTPGLLLSGDLTINDSLTLTNGVVSTGANNVIITSTASSSVVAGTGNTNYTNCWVNGYLQRYITGNTSKYDFPVGDDSYAEFLQWGNNNIEGVSNLTASFGLKPGNDAGLNLTLNGMPLDTVNSTGVWYLNPNAEPAEGSYSMFTYFGNDPGWATRPDEYFTIITRSDTSTHASSWSAPGTIPATGQPGRTYASGYAERDDFTSFSQYGIGEYLGTLLPITLVSFNAVKENANALCTWQTATEQNTAYFEVEVSTAASNLVFYPLGSVKAQGNSTSLLNYNFLDIQPGKTGIRYYRLKIVNDDSSYTYSNVIAVDFNSTQSRVGSLYPNPASTLLYYTISENNTGSVAVNIIDITGRVIIKNTFTSAMGVNTFSTDVSTLPQGMYILQFEDELGIINQKFEK